MHTLIVSLDTHWIWKAKSENIQSKQIKDNLRMVLRIPVRRKEQVIINYKSIKIKKFII